MKFYHLLSKKSTTKISAVSPLDEVNNIGLTIKITSDMLLFVV